MLEIFTALWMTVFIIGSVVATQHFVPTTAESTFESDNCSISSKTNLRNKISDTDGYISVVDPINRSETYSIVDKSGFVELNKSRGQFYRHYYNTTSQEYQYASDTLVSKPGVIADTEWITLGEYPIRFFIQTTDQETYFAATDIQAAEIQAHQTSIYCVGLETFTGSAAFYLNSQDSSWGHGQTLFYPRLANGHLPELDQPIYSWFAHLYAQQGDIRYDKIINDKSLFDQQPMVHFEQADDLYKMWYEVTDVIVFSQTFDFVFGIKYNLTENLFHTINHITCKTTGFDDLGLTYDITGTPMSASTDFRPARVKLAATDQVLSWDSNEPWDLKHTSARNNTQLQIISENEESFIFDFADMALTGFTENYMDFQEQTLPNGRSEKLLSVGMGSFGQYHQGITLTIDPIYYSPITSNHDVTLIYGDSFSKVTGLNEVGYTLYIPPQPPFEEEIPATTRKFFMLWDTGLTADVAYTSNAVLRMTCDSEKLESSEQVRFRLLESYSGESPVATDSVSTIDDYWSSSSYGSISHTPSAETTSYLNVESLTDHWADNKGSNSFIKFRVEPGSGMDSGTHDYVYYYTGGSITSKKPRLEFTYVMVTDEYVNTGFESDPIGEITSPEDITGWALAYDNGGSYYIEDDATNYLRIVNADYWNDFGGFMQQFYYDYNDEDGGDIVSGDLRLKLAGTSYAQMAYIGYYFYDAIDSQLGSVMFYIREDYQSYSNTSSQLYFNLSPYSANSNNWISDPDPGWFSYRKNLTECFTTPGFSALDTVAERNTIDYVEVRACLFTSYSNAAEAMFDNITINSIHLASDATRTLNVDENYQNVIDNITNYLGSCTSEKTYNYLVDEISDLGNDEYLTDTEMTNEIITETLTVACLRTAILTSALGRIFKIPTRIILLDYRQSGEGSLHFFAEFYWSGSWHVVDPGLGFFDDAAAVKDYFKDYDIDACYIIYEFFIAADPMIGGDPLNDSVVKFGNYANQPYYD